MSLVSDVKGYADAALAQGKKNLDHAQALVISAAADPGAFAGRVQGAVRNLPAAAQAVDLDAVKAAVEPYLAQAQGLRTVVAGKADELIKRDPRVAAAVGTVETVTAVVVEAVNERVVVPVLALAGHRPSIAKPVRRPAKKSSAAKSGAAKASAAKPAATKPAATKPASTRPATKSAPRAAAKKSTPQA